MRHLLRKAMRPRKKKHPGKDRPGRFYRMAPLVGVRIPFSGRPTGAYGKLFGKWSRLFPGKPVGMRCSIHVCGRWPNRAGLTAGHRPTQPTPRWQVTSWGHELAKYCFAARSSASGGRPTAITTLAARVPQLSKKYPQKPRFFA